jgi:sulfur-carrier protein
VKIRLYGRLAEAVGPQVELDVGVATSVGDIRRLVAEQFPQSAATLASSRSRACIGGSIVGDDHLVSAGDSVEFLPPVSGG